MLVPPQTSRCQKCKDPQLLGTTVQKLVSRSPAIYAPTTVLIYSSVGIATRYVRDGPGSKPCGDENLHTSTPALGPTQPPVQRVPGLFPRGKAAGAWCSPFVPSNVEVKERVQLYLYCSSGPSRPVLWRSLPLYITFFLDHHQWTWSRNQITRCAVRVYHSENWLVIQRNASNMLQSNSKLIT
jgi:hypothetical protein